MKLLAIDCNNIGHRARHTTGELSYKGEPTGIIFGFLNQLYTITKLIRPTHFIFAWDSRESLRKKIYPEYKANREKSEEALKELLPVFAQFRILQEEILPQLGFYNIFEFDGYEADDILAAAVQKTKDDFYNIVVVSTDEDLLQLLSHKVHIYNPYRKQLIRESDFIAAYGIHPSKWAAVKTFAGCSTDNVKGITGVGEKTSIAYIKGECKSEATRNKIFNWGYHSDLRHTKAHRINRKLVTLPFKGFPVNEISIIKHEFNQKAFQKICRQFGFDTWVNDLDWSMYFE